MTVELKYQIERTVVFRQCDMAGVMHFPEYFHLMEECEHAFLLANGIEVIGELLWPRVSCTAEFFKPVRMGDELIVGIDAINLGDTSVNYSFVVMNKADNHIVSMGTVKTVCCQKREDGSVKSCQIPESVRRVLQGNETD